MKPNLWLQNPVRRTCGLLAAEARRERRMCYMTRSCESKFPHFLDAKQNPANMGFPQELDKTQPCKLAFPTSSTHSKALQVAIFPISGRKTKILPGPRPGKTCKAKFKTTQKMSPPFRTLRLEKWRHFTRNSFGQLARHLRRDLTKHLR